MKISFFLLTILLKGFVMKAERLKHYLKGKIDDQILAEKLRLKGNPQSEFKKGIILGLEIAFNIISTFNFDKKAISEYIGSLVADFNSQLNERLLK